ncbi:MAG TPA: TPM domain-containing protein [Caulobacteraceae bacterium]|nr:TPM domain-containing protein [Caulobacteraceae bacterium]
MRLSEPDHQKIDAAIAAAERNTSGEILCIVANEVSDYREVPLAWAAAAALILPLLLIPLGFGPHWLPGFAGGWTAAHSGALDESAAATLAAYAVTQALIFALVTLLGAIPAVRRALTPKGLKARRVHRAAMEQFLAQGIHVTEARTGVLIFASLADRHAEVIADKGIYEKVKPEVWGDAVAALTKAVQQGRPAEGFVEAVSLCGTVLAAHFPPGPANPNELPDKLVVID